MKREAWPLEPRPRKGLDLSIPRWSVWLLWVGFFSSLIGAVVTYVPGGLPYGAFSWLGGVMFTLLVQLGVVMALSRRR